ncbi:hypothetical protein B0H11DRAFT_1884964 [Mycena galericulata]|nr:hypothetical protein B0H11DRAFT_1884964 [Mycena galericulata]
MLLKTSYVLLLAFIFSSSLFEGRPGAAALDLPVFLAVALPGTLVSAAQRSSSLEEKNVNPEEFWQRARDMGEKAQSYSENLITQAASKKSEDVQQKIVELQESMRKIVHGALVLNRELYALSAQRAKTDTEPIYLADMVKDLEPAFEKVLEELMRMFPAPDRRLGHEGRQMVVRAALERAGEALVAACAKYGMDEEHARVHWDKTMRPAIQFMVVLIGDLVVQHPDLLEGLLFWGAVTLIPDSWLLRPLLGVFGVGPTGPMKETSAAWAQRVFYGRTVSQDSWLSLLNKIDPPFWFVALMTLLAFVVLGSFCSGSR